MNAQITYGPDLPEITTKNLGFTALNGGNNIRLFPSSCPNDVIPSAADTGSYLTVASGRGLLAAAHEDKIIIASTHALRKALTSTEEKDAILEVDPQLSFPAPTRLSHISFSSDERYLILAAEVGGGLAVYEVDSLSQGNQNPSFQIPTDGVSLRGLVPNPAPENAHQIALVRSDGGLCIADLQNQALQPTGNGNLLASNTSCVAWSVRGKQLVAGLGDGNIAQLKPTGEVVSAIPKPESLSNSEHVGAVYWLANDEFLTVHVPPAGTDLSDARPVYHLIQRQKATSNFTYNKLDDPALPGFDRPDSIVPQYWFLRLRDFRPDLADALVAVSSKSDALGIIAKSNQPFPEHADSANTYLTATLEGNRAAPLPYESYPVGLALDLSATEKLPRPLLTALEFEESPTPLPAVMLLSSKGLLSIWWFVYDDSIKNGTGYDGLVALGGSSQATTAQTPATPASAPSPFVASNSGQTPTPALGFPKAAAATPTFGSTSFGQQGSPWGSASSTSPQAAGVAFGHTSSFGQPSTFGKTSAFGAASPLGKTGAVFGQGGSTQQETSKANAFAQTASSGGGFSAFSGFGGFNALTPKSGQSAFAKPSTPSSFGQAAQGSSPFSTIAKSNTSPFGDKPSPFASKPAASFGTPSLSFGQASSGSSLKNETSFASTLTLDSSKNESTNGSSKFSFINTSTGNTPASQQSAFGSNAQSSFGSISLESDMSGTDDRGEKEATPTPQPKPDDKAAGLFGSGPFKLGTTFKSDGSAKDDGPKPTGGSSFFSSGFGNALEDKPAEQPVTEAKSAPEQSATQAPPPSKPAFSFGNVSTLPVSASPQSNTPKTTPPKQPLYEAAPPLPPDFTKASKPSTAESAPLPPDFLSNSKPTAPKAGTVPAFLPNSKPALPSDASNAAPAIKQEQADDDDLPPIAGSPPIDVQVPDSGSEAGESDAADEDEGFEVEEHVSGEEDASELEGVGQQSPQRRASRPIPPANNWSFQSSTQSHQAPPPAPTPPVKSRSPSRSPARSGLRNEIFPSSTPLGMPKGPVFAPPAARAQESPRSPSPVRSASTPQFGRGYASVPVAKPPRPLSRQKTPTPPVPEPGFDDFDNEEDDRIRAELEAPVEPTLKVDALIVSARPDIDSREAKPGLPGQIHRVYRDINNMIDTLGLNAKALSAFVVGHCAEPLADDVKDIENIANIVYESDDEEQEWHLVEIKDLAQINTDLEEFLDEGRITDKHAKLADLTELNRNITRLRTRAKALEKHLKAGLSEQMQGFHAPLSTEQAYQQRALRKGFAELKALLREAEDAVVLLRTKIDSLETSAKGREQRNVPTVEAVTKTILRMNDMINQKGGDIAVLESEMRALRVGSTEPSSLSASRASLNRSRNGVYSFDVDEDEDADVNEEESPIKQIPGAFRSPYATPQARRYGSEAPSSGRTGESGAWHTPGSRFQSPAGSAFWSPAASQVLERVVDESAVREKADKMRRRRALVGKFEKGVGRGERRISTFTG